MTDQLDEVLRRIEDRRADIAREALARHEDHNDG